MVHDLLELPELHGQEEPVGHPFLEALEDLLDQLVEQEVLPYLQEEEADLLSLVEPVELPYQVAVAVRLDLAVLVVHHDLVVVAVHRDLVVLAVRHDLVAQEELPYQVGQAVHLSQEKLVELEEHHDLAVLEEEAEEHCHDLEEVVCYLCLVVVGYCPEQVLVVSVLARLKCLKVRVVQL